MPAHAILLDSQFIFTSMTAKQGSKTRAASLGGEIFGGVAAMMVALPSAIAFGLIIYGPLGSGYSGRAAVAGVVGTIVLGLIAPFIGRTARLISAPCAPAAAVLSVFVADLLAKGNLLPEQVPLYLAIVAAGAGLLQFVTGRLGGGAFIKYIPYPVVTGYLSGVGILIFLGQLPKFLGLAKETTLGRGILAPGLWQWQSMAMGGITIATMLLAPRIIKKVPAAIVALAAGITSYGVLALIDPALRNIQGNPFIIGPISASLSGLAVSTKAQFLQMPSIQLSMINTLWVPLITLAVLLSVDTLKTCVVLDAISSTRHQSNRELVGQGISNFVAGLLGGIPGAGTMGASLVNSTSGGRSFRSGVVMGISSLFVLVLAARFLAWIPVASLAGILLVVAMRMLDTKSLSLLKHRSTRFDFAVILAVVVAAVSKSLIAAAGVGIAFSIFLFVRQQVRTPVIRRLLTGGKMFSKKIRTQSQQNMLEQSGGERVVAELQGQLFFGTMDKFMTELDPHLAACRFLVLDMKRVQSIDFTAVNRLKQLRARMEEQSGVLVLASVPQSLPSGQNVRRYLGHLGLAEAANLLFFNDRDSAIEWTEDALLREKETDKLSGEDKLDLTQLELFSHFPDEARQTIYSAILEKNYPHDALLFRAGQSGEEMFIIRSGTVRIMLPLASGVNFPVASFARGAFFGEMSFLDRGLRSANAVTDGPVSLFVLSRSAFDKATAGHAEAARLFFERLAHGVSHRLRQANVEVKALQEE